MYLLWRGVILIVNITFSATFVTKLAPLNYFFKGPRPVGPPLATALLKIDNIKALCPTMVNKQFCFYFSNLQLMTKKVAWKQNW